jgi:hypothetical protein
MPKLARYTKSTTVDTIPVAKWFTDVVPARMNIQIAMLRTPPSNKGRRPTRSMMAMGTQVEK